MDIRKQIYRFIDMYVDTAEPKKLCSSIHDLVEELAEYKVKNIEVIPCSKSDSVFIIQHKESGVIHGCFNNKTDAERFKDESKNLVLLELTFY